MAPLSTFSVSIVSVYHCFVFSWLSPFLISRIKSVSLNLVEYFRFWWHLYGESNDNDDDDIYSLTCRSADI